MMKEINGVNFEVVKGEKAKQNIKHKVSYHGTSKGIFDIYGRPSQTKIEIWQDWKRFFSDINGACGCLCGGSSTFSIGGYAFIDGKEATFYITKEHNKVVFE